MTDAFAKQQIRGWLLEFLDEPEHQHAFPVEINVHGSGRVEVFVDSDDAVSFSLCRRISRHLEAHLDEGGMLGERYTLEVSSPGATRPLSLPRQFPKHVGRTLEVKIDDERAVTGELKGVSESGITLEETRTFRDERNKRQRETVTHELPFGEFRGATVQLKFK